MEKQPCPVAQGAYHWHLTLKAPQGSPGGKDFCHQSAVGKEKWERPHLHFHYVKYLKPSCKNPAEDGSCLANIALSWSWELHSCSQATQSIPNPPWTMERQHKPGQSKGSTHPPNTSSWSLVDPDLAERQIQRSASPCHYHNCVLWAPFFKEDVSNLTELWSSPPQGGLHKQGWGSAAAEKRGVCCRSMLFY